MSTESTKKVASAIAPYLREEFERYISKTPDRLRMAAAIARLLPQRREDDPPVHLRDFYLEDHLGDQEIEKLSKAMVTDKPLDSKLVGFRHFQHCSVCRAVVEAEAARRILAREVRRLRRGDADSGGRKVPEGITDQSRAYMRGSKSRF